MGQYILGLSSGINNHFITIACQSWNNIYMLCHSKSTMLKLNIIGYFLLFLICPCMICSKEKICKENQNQKESKCFKYGCKRVSKRCES